MWRFRANLTIFFTVSFFATFGNISTITVDNDAIGQPDIKCEDTFIGVYWRTRRPFLGHVFVKSHYLDKQCRTDETNRNETQIQVPLMSCGVNRSRSTEPRGLTVNVTVIISFHEQFLTTADQAYSICCFYMESEKVINAELEVSMLTTAVQTKNVPMPQCRYEVLEGSPAGDIILQARVGDPVYHKWSCHTSTRFCNELQVKGLKIADTFCMMVHTCSVDDGAGRKTVLVDADGCAQDKYLLGNIEYADDLIAGKESHVFKYADKPNLYFNCQISIIIKEPGSICPRPKCHEPERGKRQIDWNDDATILDVNSNSVRISKADVSWRHIVEFANRRMCLNIMVFCTYALINILLFVGSFYFICSLCKKLC